MLCSSLRTAFIITSLAQSTFAQTSTDQLWQFPDPNKPDLSQTFTNGQTIPAAWGKYTTTTILNVYETLVDLWITSFDWEVNQYSHLLRKSVNITVPGTETWTIDIPDSYLSTSAKYVLRFRVGADSYTPTWPEFSSRGFIVVKSSTTSNTGSSTSGTKSTSSASAPTANPTSTSARAVPGGGDLSTGAKAGIGVGVSLGIILIVCLLAVVLVKKRRARRNQPHPSYDEKNAAAARHEKPPVEMSSTSEPVELPTSH